MLGICICKWMVVLTSFWEAVCLLTCPVRPLPASLSFRSHCLCLTDDGEALSLSFLWVHHQHNDFLNDQLEATHECQVRETTETIEGSQFPLRSFRWMNGVPLFDDWHNSGEGGTKCTGLIIDDSVCRSFTKEWQSSLHFESFAAIFSLNRYLWRILRSSTSWIFLKFVVGWRYGQAW